MSDEVKALHDIQNAIGIGLAGLGIQILLAWLMLKTALNRIARELSDRRKAGKQ